VKAATNRWSVLTPARPSPLDCLGTREALASGREVLFVGADLTQAVRQRLALGDASVSRGAQRVPDGVHQPKAARVGRDVPHFVRQSVIQRDREP